MTSVNLIMLIGRLGHDPELITFANGGAITRVSIATSTHWYDKNGTRQEQTQWHRVVFTGKSAEMVFRLFKKGDEIYVEGKIHHKQWMDKAGQIHYFPEIQAHLFQNIKEIM